MSDEANMLDGNALGGMLHEAFGADLTAAKRRCQTCGAERPVAEHRLYRGAGNVLRCPACGDIGLVITSLPDRHIVGLEGSWLMELAHRDAADSA